MPITRILILAALSSLAGGCVAKAAFDVATAPVRVVGKTADLLTTSQEERDRARGRALRESEERMADLERRYREQSEKCFAGDEDACEDRRETREAMDQERRELAGRGY